MNKTTLSTGQSALITPAQLGFEELKSPKETSDPPSWRKGLGGRAVTFRLLRSIEDLNAAEALQRDVFGVTDYDLIPASELAIVHETGGEVIAAFILEAGGEHADLVRFHGGALGVSIERNRRRDETPSGSNCARTWI
jgi:hypothetical protein